MTPLQPLVKQFLNSQSMPSFWKNLGNRVSNRCIEAIQRGFKLRTVTSPAWKGLGGRVDNKVEGYERAQVVATQCKIENILNKSR